MGRFLEKLMAAPEVKPLLSDEHFSVDGTLLLSRVNQVEGRFASTKCYPSWLTPGSTGISTVPLPCIPGLVSAAAAAISRSIHCSR